METGKGLAESGICMKSAGDFEFVLIGLEGDSALIQQDKDYLAGWCLNCQYYLLVRAYAWTDNPPIPHYYHS
jgi:hypothetical protein